MKHVKALLIELEKFVECNADGADGIHFSRQNLKSMFLDSLKNTENASETPALFAETFFFIDAILESLNGIQVDELTTIQELIDQHGSTNSK